MSFKRQVVPPIGSPKHTSAHSTPDERDVGVAKRKIDGASRQRTNIKRASSGSKPNPRVAPRKTGSGDGKPASLGSKPGSGRGTRPPDTHTEEESPGEQDIKFFNIPSKWEKAEISDTPKETQRKLRDISPEEILAQSQENDPGHVYEILLHAARIGKIQGLETFTKVRVLDLSCNFIQDIENLDKNQDLRELKLYDNYITEIKNLESLKELSHLQLQHNKLKSIGKGLSCQKKLKILRLDSNKLSKLDSRELAPLSQLTSLDISGNGLDSLAALNCLPNLEELFATNNKLRTVTDLGRCKKLQEIDLSSNQLTDVSGLRGLAQLNTLHLTKNQFATLKSLGKSKSLHELVVSNNRLTELQSLVEQFPGLEHLNVCDNHIEQWEQVVSLQKLQNLMEVFLQRNPFCSPRGPKPHYSAELQRLMPALEIIDGAHVKRSTSTTAPVMRPMSAASVISTRQVDAQMSSLLNEMSTFENNVMQSFKSLRATFDTLPVEPPKTSRLATARSLPSTAGSDRPASRSSRRSRITEARNFAAQHF
ncbi:protein phosphatase 1 regulatory subunit 7 isoform X2 [Lingula anatina]|uniref:Protein phosphatase 1 regulatory subunit 7 isoform X2 n=1 Tax=Lingula anatina TaxID=7574 RepID=A0A1S3J1I4_LINAN|nr:protein phosphatase 1 regulatory subunit 7 isoform X2 [Lingula anatina]|eukprot:XP_013404126.1 protein phosphatase 1 regulatory subunit 7 isoform X2 [Lingula anatina]